MSDLKVKQLPREFVFKKGGENIYLSDPNANMTPSEVLKFYASTYPELTNSSVDVPKIKTNKIVYNINQTVGRKG